MGCVTLFLPCSELKWTARRPGLSDNFPRRGGAVQVPRVLGSQQGRILGQEALPVLLGLFPPSRRCCREREFCIFPSLKKRINLRPGPCRSLWHPIPCILHQNRRVCPTYCLIGLLLTFDSQHIPPDSLDIYAILRCKHGYVCNLPCLRTA